MMHRRADAEAEYGERPAASICWVSLLFTKLWPVKFYFFFLRVFDVLHSNCNVCVVAGKR
jgi:hypothetical protein